MMADTSFPYDVLTVTSPMRFGGEEKNEDRARWYATSRTAVVCDGVSSSPYSALAAEIVTENARVLFQGSIDERLHQISDFLVNRRLEAQQSTIHAPADVPEPMAEMLRDAARQRMTQAFQTTLVAAAFTPTDDALLASVACCGGSAFMAYAPHGAVLTTSMTGSNHSEKRPCTNDRAQRFPFGPGDELLVKVKGCAVAFANLVRQVGLAEATAHKWLVCSALDRCGHTRASSPNAWRSEATQWVDPDDLLLVPQHVVGSVGGTSHSPYRRVRFSRLIRLINGRVAPSHDLRFDGAGTATAVIPDHYYTGDWSHFEDRFPADTHFLLASDGLTGCFRDPAELWSWLQSHEVQLADPSQRNTLLHELHAQRHAKRSDDDISFVWLTPAAEANDANPEEHGDAD